MATRSFKVKNGLIIGATTEITSIVDEDNMASDSATALSTQQAIKAYVDAQVASADTFLELSDTAGSYTASALLAVNAAGNAVAMSELIYTVSSNDITIKNATSDKDIIFSVNDGGSTAELFRLDASESVLTMASGKKLGFVDGAEAISGDGTNLTINSGADINLTCASGDINVPANIGLTFGDDGEKIEGDGTDLTIASSNNTTITSPGTLSLNTTGITTVAGDLTVSGDLIVSGDTTTVNTATLSVEDPLIILASGNNAADSIDIGMYGLYDTSGSQDLYSGLFRDASDSGKWKLFKDNQAAPTTTVNTGGTGYAVGTLVANLEGSVTAANAIDSDQYVDGSIDLAHMSSESVDEDNLYISNAGSNGQYLSKQSGNSGGLTWADVTAPPISSYTNSTNNRVLTSVDSSTVNGEANLTFDGSALTVTGTGTFAGHVTPSANDTYDLGSASYQWRDIYTGDINLNNTKTRDNEVDGTRGSWTIQEGEEDLFLLNRKNGKKYKFNLTEMK